MRGGSLKLRPGDIVEVKPAAEILATLDADGALDAMPFMPEMLQYVGRRFTVSRRVEKICDTIAADGQPSSARHGLPRRSSVRRIGPRWLPGGLPDLLEGGVASARGRHSLPANHTESDTVRELERRAQASTRTVRELDGEPEEVWRCQATDALKATEPLKTSGPSAVLARATKRKLRSAPLPLRLGSRLLL